MPAGRISDEDRDSLLADLRKGGLDVRDLTADSTAVRLQLPNGEWLEISWRPVGLGIDLGES